MIVSLRYWTVFVFYGRHRGEEKERASIPVIPTKLTTTILCAESSNGRVLSRIASKRDTFAFLAAWWAARNRATFCSGVSMPDEDAPEPGDRLGPPVLPDGTALPFVGLAAPEPILEEACGVVGVNRVADEAVRSLFLGGMVEMWQFAWCRGDSYMRAQGEKVE